MKGGRADRGGSAKSLTGKMSRLLRKKNGGGGGWMGRGRGAQIRSPGGLQQRVTVQGNITKHAGGGAAALNKHVAYLQRDGAGKDDDRAEAFTAEQDEINAGEHTREWAEDRHHFRLMISPENGHQLQSLSDYTREVMAEAERDLGVKLDWVAVEHHNTGHPHVHVLLRGKEPDGSDLVIARRYMAHGFRARASQQATAELGHRTEKERRAAIEKEVSADRLTSLDRALAKRVSNNGILDDRAPKGAKTNTEYERHLRGRVRHLERAGLAFKFAPNQFRMQPGWQAELRERGEKNDIIRTIQRGGSHDVAAKPYRASEGVFAGRVIQKGVANELKDTPYIVVSDGRGEVRYLTVARPFDAEAIKPGSIVVIGSDKDKRAPNETAKARAEASVKRGYAAMQIVSAEPLGPQISAPRATQIDAQLMRAQHAPWHEAAGGEPMLDAMDRRANWLVKNGYADRQKTGAFSFKAGALEKLRAAELEHFRSQVSQTTGRDYRPAPPGASEGRVTEIRNLSTGRTLVIERQGRFTTAPAPRNAGIKTGDRVAIQKGPKGKARVSKIEKER